MPAERTILLLAILPSLALAETAATPSINMRGECSVSATPDRAQLAATVLRQGHDPARAAADTTQTYNKFRDHVAALQLPDLVLQSDGVQTAQIAETDPDGHQRITGYQGSATLMVETSAVAKLADVMRLAAQDGVDQVSPMSVFVSDDLRKRLIEDCLPKAAADARAKAASLLHGLGLAPGAVLLVDNYNVQGGEAQADFDRAACAGG